MGLFSRLLLLPLAPVQGVLWLAEVLEDIAEREEDPSRLREVLRDTEAAHRAGELSADELAAVEQQVLDRLVVLTPYEGVAADG